MSATTFFANRVRAALIDPGLTPTVYTSTMTNGSTTISSNAPISNGGYLWLNSDGQQYAGLCIDSSHLAFNYLGVGGSGNSYYATPQLFAVTRGFQLSASWENRDLYGTDSTERVDEARDTLKVTVKIKYAKWDPIVSNDWISSVLDPIAGSGAYADTNLQYINGGVVFMVPGSNGTSIMRIVCGRVYWDGLPNTIPENDFIVRDLTGYAKGVCFYG